MEKYITSLKDLIAETFRNSFKLNEMRKMGTPKRVSKWEWFICLVLTQL